HTETPYIGSLVHLKTARLFRRHVTDCAHNHAWFSVDRVDSFCLWIRNETLTFSQFSQTKVQHLYVPIMPDHDVFRLDVSMDDSGLMSCRQSRTHLHHRIERFC